jgi:zinc D-Ala-D-Ala dipeptidase
LLRDLTLAKKCDKIMIVQIRTSQIITYIKIMYLKSFSESAVKSAAIASVLLTPFSRTANASQITEFRNSNTVQQTEAIFEKDKPNLKLAEKSCPTPESETPANFVSLADAGYPSELIHLVYKDKGGDNKFGCPLYAEDQRAFVLNQEMAQAMIDANKFMREKYKLQIKIVDAFRTNQAQEIAYDIAQSKGISSEYVAKPGNGKHPQGRAVDLILVDMEGNKVGMKVPFDTFSSKSHFDSSNPNQKKLREVMTKFGFKPYGSEYWHFSWTK